MTTRKKLPRDFAQRARMIVHVLAGLCKDCMSAHEIPLMAEGCSRLTPPLFLHQQEPAGSWKRYVGDYSNT